MIRPINTYFPSINKARHELRVASSMLDVTEMFEKKRVHREAVQVEALKTFNERRNERRRLLAAARARAGDGADEVTLVRTETAGSLTSTAATTSTEASEAVREQINEAALNDGDEIDEDGLKLTAIFDVSKKRKKTWNCRPDGWETIAEYFAEFGKKSTLSAFKDVLKNEHQQETPDQIYRKIVQWKKDWENGKVGRNFKRRPFGQKPAWGIELDEMLLASVKLDSQRLKLPK
jgi:hypothetical protein